MKENQKLNDEIREFINKELQKGFDEIDGKIAVIAAEVVASTLDAPLSIKQVAKITGRSEQCIYKFCQKGIISFEKVSGRVSVNLRSVNENLLRLYRKHNGVRTE